MFSIATRTVNAALIAIVIVLLLFIAVLPALPLCMKEGR